MVLIALKEAEMTEVNLLLLCIQVQGTLRCGYKFPSHLSRAIILFLPSASHFSFSNELGDYLLILGEELSSVWSEENQDDFRFAWRAGVAGKWGDSTLFLNAAEASRIPSGGLLSVCDAGWMSWAPRDSRSWCSGFAFERSRAGVLLAELMVTENPPGARLCVRRQEAATRVTGSLYTESSWADTQTPPGPQSHGGHFSQARIPPALNMQITCGASTLVADKAMRPS